MPRYKVTCPKGIPYGEGLKKGEFFTDTAHNARVRAWLRFKQIELASDKEQSGESRPPEISAASKKLAEENGIDITTITGTGANGAIVKADVEAAIEAAKQP